MREPTNLKRWRQERLNVHHQGRNKQLIITDHKAHNDPICLYLPKLWSRFFSHVQLRIRILGDARVPWRATEQSEH